MIEYKYNAEGIRVVKVRRYGTEIKYLMEGLSVLCEYQEGGGDFKGVCARNIGETERNHLLFIIDRLGNVRYVLDFSGAIVQSYLYTPFGQIHSSSGLLNQGVNLFDF